MNKIGICNLALAELGNSRISSLNEENEASRQCALHIDQVIAEVLSEPNADWQCARTRADCGAAVTDEPAFGWDSAFQKPSDCLRVIRQVGYYDDTANYMYKVEGDYILTNESKCYILYVKNITDVTKLPSYLVDCIVTKLASKLALRLATDPSISESLLQRYLQLTLPNAIAADNAQIYEEEGNNSWQTAGRN